ncbi:MAG: hypothetical protein QMC17_05680 [Paracoccaceae bacterium]|jgi:pentatricopeptide repeat protein
MSIGFYDLTEAHFSALIDHAPYFTEAYNALITAYFLAKNYDQAMSYIQKVLVCDPCHYGALAGFALILENLKHLKHPKAALNVCRAALAVNPHMAQSKSAIEWLEKALSGQES